MRNLQHLLGRYSFEDERDYDYILRPTLTDRKVRKWRRGPMTDQGTVPSCVGHGWYHLLTSTPVRQEPIAANVLYYVAQHFDEWDGEAYDGTSVRAGAKVLKFTKCIKSYGWAFNLATAIPHLLEKGPLVAGFDWYEGMFAPDQRNIIKTTGRIAGGHCVLIYGVNLRTGFFYIQNSWGKDWGYKGTARISFEDVEKLLKHGGECCTALEQSWLQNQPHGNNLQ